MIRCFIIGLPFLFLTSNAEAQSVKKHELRSNGLCSSTIILFSDHYYNKESGCEASSRFSFGKWSRAGDTIKFYSVDKRAFRVINKVVARSTKDKELTVKVSDKYGENISSKVVAGQRVLPHVGSLPFH